jgi:hypothetical protein
MKNCIIDYTLEVYGLWYCKKLKQWIDIKDAEIKFKNKHVILAEWKSL